jgi:hypothetical protein
VYIAVVTPLSLENLCQYNCASCGSILRLKPSTKVSANMFILCMCVGGGGGGGTGNRNLDSVFMHLGWDRVNTVKHASAN